MSDLLAIDAAGLACAAGGFHVDPWQPVARAVVTHAHGDHARPGTAEVFASRDSIALLRRRLGPEVTLTPLDYGEPIRLGEVTVSLHPAGHVLGSAQVRVERGGEVWVVSGDYKRAPDPTCAPFEVVRCDVFVTEATFALPIYRWPEPRVVTKEIVDWWSENRRAGRPSALFCYALGKAQRILAELAAVADRPILVHGQITALLEAYEQAGVRLAPTIRLAEDDRRKAGPEDLVLAPPSARGTPWMKRLGGASTAFASGWMRLRGARRRRALDRGFALSDHADWDGLLRTVQETGASRVLATHGYAEALARTLRERGLEARALRTAWEGETES